MKTMATFVAPMIAVAAALSACSAAPDPTGSTSTSQDLSTAADPPGRMPSPCTPFSLPPDNCGFQVDVGCVSNNEFQTVTTQPDGTLVIDVTGRLVLSSRTMTPEPPSSAT